MGGGSLSGSNLSIFPKLLAGSGGFGLDTFIKLAGMMSSFVPSANQSSCPNVRWKKKAICNAPCVSLCPFKAISVTDSISIDPSKCVSCNICATSCPQGVFDPMIPSDSGLYDGILAARKKGKNIIRFSCDRCHGRYGKPRRRGVKGAETIVLPCLGSLSEALPVYAMQLGCRVTIDLCPEDCMFSEGRKCYELAMRRSESVRGSFVVRPYDVSRATGDRRVTGLERRKLLLSAGENIMKILFDLEEPRRNGLSPDLYRQSLPPRRKELLILTKGLEPIARNVSLENYPILDLQINKALCNLCEVCSIMCPTRALRYAEKGNSGSIAFSLGKCTGCRLCIEVCPKSCVSSSDASLGDINSCESVLIEKKICKCKSCDFKFVRDPSFVGEEVCSMCVKKRSLVTKWGQENRIEATQTALNR